MVNGSLNAEDVFTQGNYVNTVEGDSSPRIEYAANHLKKAIADIPQPEKPVRFILSSDKLEEVVGNLSPEGYHLFRERYGEYHIQGYGDSGTLYGALEFAARKSESNKLPDSLNVTESPAFRLRGPCIGMQIPAILPYCLNATTTNIHTRLKVFQFFMTRTNGLSIWIF